MEQVEKYKYLGIILDTDMSYKSQLSKTVSQLNSKIWILKHFRNYMDVKTSLIIMKAMVLPYLDNASLMLSGIRLFDQKRLQILQNIALRLCYNIKDPTLISVKKLHEKAKVLPIDLRRNYLQVITCHRLIQLNALSLVENRRTRAGDGPLIVDYLMYTKRVQVSPANSAFNAWNNVKVEFRTIEDSVVFKRRIKSSIKKDFIENWRYDLQFTLE